MTRITNFGRKRTYLEANQAPAQPPDKMEECGTISKLTADPEAKSAPASMESLRYSGKADEPTSEPPKKRRKRGPKSKGNSDQGDRCESGEAVGEMQGYPVVASGAKRGKKLDRRKKVAASETRRLKRVNQRFSETICFACRKKGHAARDCPKSVDGGEGEDGHGNSKAPVGICYRCGSQTHSLSRCTKPSNPDHPFPFALCFVCNGKGHLASGCPQNKGKGIYPNGGCCKLCGETTHLARNCTMRQTENDPTAFIGTARGAGADEDDFHTFRRTTLELDRAEKREEKVKKMLEVKKGAFSGAVVRLDDVSFPSAKRKVVMFK